VSFSTLFAPDINCEVLIIKSVLANSICFRVGANKLIFLSALLKIFFFSTDFHSAPTLKGDENQSLSSSS
jgi:hypothetical protein